MGYAIPIRSLFSGRIVWQGICYTLVGIFSKLICGIFVMLSHTITQWRRAKPRMSNISARAVTTRRSNDSSNTFPPSTDPAKKRTPSLLPVSALLGSAMVARGEISLLILNLAREASPELMPDELFYIAIWATLLCTIAGPLTVGIIVKRMKRDNKALPAEWGQIAKVSLSPARSTQSETSANAQFAEATVVADSSSLSPKGKDGPKAPPATHRFLWTMRPHI
jgi:hypothetical protein